MKLHIQKVKSHSKNPNDPAQDVHDEAHHIAYSYAKTSPKIMKVNPPNNLTPHHSTSACLNNEVLLSKSVSQITSSMHGQALVNKILWDTKWSGTTCTSVDWPSIGKEFLCLSPPSIIPYVKLMFNLHQTNSKNNKYYGTTESCPCCGTSREMFWHLLECPSSNSKTARSSALDNLSSSLKSINTPPDIASITLSFIVDPTTPPASASALQEHLFESQWSIGWDHFLCSRISIEWQSAYRSAHFPTKYLSPEKWAAKFIMALWAYSQSPWAHRNEVVHGRGLKELEARKKDTLAVTVSSLYKQYQEDPFLIPAHLR